MAHFAHGDPLRHGVAFWIVLSIFVSLINVPRGTVARYPNVFPFRDECMGIDLANCKERADKGKCSFFQDQYPWCFDKNFAAMQPKRKARVGISTLFFTFSSGVHLSEGTHQKIFYNLTPDECAAECLRSAGVCPESVRCLSFDFYPFEDPKQSPPWNESPDAGVCVLNNENKDSARLRNSDLGYSDANLYYRGHFTFFPFADTEGYYEIRDPRGGGLAYQLDYGSYNEDIPATNNIWGGSRWGIYHFQVPRRTEWVTECPPIDPGSDDSQRPLYHGGYTPVNFEQKCPGLVTFTEAEQLCEQSGGYLCSDEQLDALVGVKIGCGFDGPVRGFSNLRDYPIWSEQDRGKLGSNARKFPRCCASYSLLDSCEAYRSDGIIKKKPQQEYPQCSRYKTATDCVHFGSGTVKQRQLGMGIFMDKIRADCQRDTTKCKGVIQNWAPRDNCVWCPTQGLMDGGGAGECRVGSSLAICQKSPALLRNTWIHSVRTSPFCYPLTFTACKLIHAYPDLGKALIDGSRNNTQSPTSPGGTRAPTFDLPRPRCIRPTFAPTGQPTGKATYIGNAEDPLGSPTVKSPTPKPTNALCINLTIKPNACKARGDCIWINNRCRAK